MNTDARSGVTANKKPLDVAFLGDETDDGGGRKVLRVRADGASIGELRPLAHGKPLPSRGEIVKLSPREGAPANVCDVETALELGADAHASSGPAKVSSDAYREGWDRIFSAAPIGELN